MFDENNCCSVSLADLSERFCGSELNNKLLNIIHEVSDIKVKDITKFKAVVTGDTISVEEKYKPRYKINPFAHHIFAMNNLPEVPNADEGFFRRLQIVPFENRFSEEQQANFNFDKLITESSLNYLANIALRKYLKMRDEHRKKFSNYKESDELVKGYKNADNSAAIFLQDISNFANLVDISSGKIITKLLYEQYCRWCFQNNFKPLSKGDFKKIALGNGLLKHSSTLKNGYDCLEYVNDDIVDIKNKVMSNLQSFQIANTKRTMKF